MLGYLLIILLLAIIIANSLLNLGRMTRITNVILSTDQQALALEKQMVDSFLSLVRNAQKYQVTNDQAFRQLSERSAADFREAIRQLLPKLLSPEETALAARIQNSYRGYSALLEKALDSLDPEYLSPTEREAKDKNAEDVTGALNELAAWRQQRITDETQELRGIGSRAILMVQILVAVSLVAAAVIAFVVTRGINAPLRKITKMTTVVSVGDFGQHIALDSPPELAELARSFNHMSDKLKQLDEMKSGFISHVSHELRTPLASIKEANSLLLEGARGPVPEEQRRFLVIVEQASAKLMTLINNLLDLSKMEAGMMEYSFSLADIRPILAHGLKGIEVLAERKGVTLTSLFPKTLPKAWMDINKMQQVVDNLLSNAVKYTPEGQRIEVIADIYQPTEADGMEKQGGLHLGVSISDTGIGIPPEYQARIFDKFQEIKRKGIPEVKGSGLGLSIARNIILAHGGRIRVKSAPGVGSTFTFVIPVERRREPRESSGEKDA